MSLYKIEPNQIKFRKTKTKQDKSDEQFFFFSKQNHSKSPDVSIEPSEVVETNHKIIFKQSEEI